MLYVANSSILYRNPLSLMLFEIYICTAHAFVTIRVDNFICINVHIIHVSCSMECIF